MTRRSRLPILETIARRGTLSCLVVAALVVWPITASAQVWKTTSTIGAPTTRFGPSAVWTGSRMIVWGGSFLADLNTGGTYDPESDTWSAMSTAGAPIARRGHAGVWTGSKMVVWGGVNGFTDLGTGGVYDPDTDTWTPTSFILAPLARESFTAVWTGSKMIVWGGVNEGTFVTPLRDGAIYDPVADTWTPMSTVGAPEARFSHTAVWTGSKMIVWGGARYFDEGMNTGGIYDPATDTWAPTSTTGAPSARDGQAGVWVGSKMVIWGGETPGDYTTTGGIYDPATDTWTATNNTGVPNNGSTYPEFSVVTTGAQMMLWGGRPQSGGPPLNTGAIFDLATNTWTPTAVAGAPAARSEHSAVWTGSRMIVWGGDPSGSTGGVYDPHGVSAQHTDYYTVSPCRVVDTRDPSRGGPTPLAAGSNAIFVVGSACAVPATAQGVSLNITVTQPTAAGDLRLYPLGTMVPLASAINYSSGQTRANNALAPLGDGGALGVHIDQGSGTVHVIIDVNGFFQ